MFEMPEMRVEQEHPMKDHKGYECRPFDWQDRVVLGACALAALFIIIILGAP